MTKAERQARLYQEMAAHASQTARAWYEPGPKREYQALAAHYYRVARYWAGVE